MEKLFKKPNKIKKWYGKSIEAKILNKFISKINKNSQLFPSKL